MRLLTWIREVWWSFSLLHVYDEKVRRSLFQVAFLLVLGPDLERVKASPRTKERLLLLVDAYLRGDLSTREFSRSLYRFIHVPTRGFRVLSLTEFTRITGGKIIQPTYFKLRREDRRNVQNETTS